MKSDKKSEIEARRRSFLKKASYVGPAVLTMTSIPSFASSGSGHEQNGREEISWDENHTGEEWIYYREDGVVKKKAAAKKRVVKKKAAAKKRVVKKKAAAKKRVVKKKAAAPAKKRVVKKKAAAKKRVVKKKAAVKKAAV